MSLCATSINVEGHMNNGHLDKDDFAVQSLLLLGHPDSLESAKLYAANEMSMKCVNDVDRHIPYIISQEYHSAHKINNEFLGNMRQYCSDLDNGSQTLTHEVISKSVVKPVTNAQQKHIEKITSKRRAEKINITSMSVGGFSNINDVCPSDHSHMNEDLSNALLSSSLVLGSLSKSKKDSRKSECPSTSTQELPKRKRLLPPTASKNNVESTPLPLVNPPQLLDLSSHIKERKSSSERYRQRNHRRKQFFDSKLVKVVDLLQKYRLLLSAEVSQRVA